MATATAGTKPCKKMIYMYLRMLQLCKSVQYAYRSENLLRLNAPTEFNSKRRLKISH